MFVYAKSLEIYFEFFITIVDRYENLMIQIRYYTTLHHIFKCSFSMLVIGMYRTVFFIVCYSYSYRSTSFCFGALTNFNFECFLCAVRLTQHASFMAPDSTKKHSKELESFNFFKKN